MGKEPLTDEEGEVRELDEEEFRSMRPAAEVLPPELMAVLKKRRPGQRGPGKAAARKMVTLRIKPAVLDAYKATGPGWQTRMAEVLESGLREHQRSRESK